MPCTPIHPPPPPSPPPAPLPPPPPGKITVIAELPQYLIIEGSIAALNDAPSSRSLFAYLQKAGAGPSDPFDLVQISTAKGTVVSTPVAGPNADLPWSLEYFSV
jgi:hypothetical protein